MANNKDYFPVDTMYEAQQNADEAKAWARIGPVAIDTSPEALAAAAAGGATIPTPEARPPLVSSSEAVRQHAVLQDYRKQLEGNVPLRNTFNKILGTLTGGVISLD